MLAYYVICFLVGFICAYFLNAYIVLGMAVISMAIMVLMLKGPHQAEGGLIAVFTAGFAGAFLLGLSVGCIPYVPWESVSEYISRLKIREFFKHYILR